MILAFRFNPFTLTRSSFLLSLKPQTNKQISALAILVGVLEGMLEVIVPIAFVLMN